MFSLSSSIGKKSDRQNNFDANLVETINSARIRLTELNKNMRNVK